MLTVNEAVRKRPTMYMGPLDRIHYAILEEMMCVARENAQCSDDIQLSITLFTMCRARVEFTGAFGIEPLKAESGKLLKSELESFLTELYACKKDKVGGDKFDFCKGSVSSANALCRDLTAIVITPEGKRYFQYYSKGVPTSNLEYSKLSAEADPNTTTLSFQVDFELFPGLDFDYDQVVDWCKDNLDNIEATIKDARNGKSFKLNRSRKEKSNV